MFKKNKASLPTKKTMNFVHDEVAKNNKRAVAWFIVFLVALAIFVQVGVIRPLQKVNEAEAEYNRLSASLEELRANDADYDEVKAEYDELVGSYLTDEERASLNRPDILLMIEKDVIPYVPVRTITISGSQISIQTDTTTLATVSSIIKKLQDDSDNAYATVVTAAASNTDDSLVTANFRITFASSLLDSDTVSTTTGGDQ